MLCCWLICVESRNLVDFLIDHLYYKRVKNTGGKETMMGIDPDNRCYGVEQDDYDPPVDVEAIERELTAALCRIEDLEAERDNLLAILVRLGVYYAFTS